MANHTIGTVLTAFGTFMARPQAFLILLAYVALWIVFQPDTFDWHGAATVATWAMTLFIQRSEHRDTQALHAKLDELLHATGAASNALTRIDDREPEAIEALRGEMKRGD